MDETGGSLTFLVTNESRLIGSGGASQARYFAARVVTVTSSKLTSVSAMFRFGNTCD
jgi:hypothetical protein